MENFLHGDVKSLLENTKQLSKVVLNNFKPMIPEQFHQIWQKGIEIVKLVYLLLNDFPKEELYALSSQLKRASISVPSNIAEGYGRNTDKSLGYFLDITRGSLFEIENQLVIAKEIGFITDEKTYNNLLNQIEVESKMINAFSKKFKS